MMLKKGIHILIFSVLLCVYGPCLAQQEWELIKNKEGIEVFTRTNNVMSFKEFRGKMTIDSRVSDFMSVMYDVEGLVSWGYNLRTARLLERPADSLQIYYAVAKSPWPYKDRDGVYLNKFSWDEQTKTLVVAIELLEDPIETEGNFVRIGGYGSWEVRELSSEEIEIVFQMQIDPRGSIKAWMANMFASDTPFYTLKGLKEALKMEKYQGKSHPLLEN
jgi:hypothetical protein